MQQLRRLAHLYFHQDWDLEADTPVEALANFRRDENVDRVGVLRAELVEILSSNPSEPELEEVWDRSGAAWDPQIAGWGTYREWFDTILKAVS
ncbi:contact-dependent growth inhibition system immunity protein [Luteimicrobium sp. DT211]|uniref:contact-dependent growth inhibition system immunity protein n=1 Tax=Luteimicrobium sp. DT211 TaxID=3393412 RepID=UPI003CF7A5FD